jgi:hypothetical protein
MSALAPLLGAKQPKVSLLYEYAQKVKSESMMQDEIASFALFDANTKLISVFPAASLAEAVTIKIQRLLWPAHARFHIGSTVLLLILPRTARFAQDEFRSCSSGQNPVFRGYTFRNRSRNCSCVPNSW